MVLTEDPELMRALVVERLVGATGDPRRVSEAARSRATRALTRVMDALEEKLPAAVKVELIDVEIVRLAELKPKEDCCDALAVIAGEVSGDALTMRLDPTAISILVGTMFGGNPELPAVPLQRPPSAIERDVAALTFDIFAKALNGKGARSLGLRLLLPTVQSGADFRRFVVRDGPGVRMRFAIGGEESGGVLTAWMPQRLLLEARELEGSDQRQQNAKAADWHNRFSDEVMRSNVRIRATIPLMRMALGELASLHEGQVIEFGDGAQPEARLAVRDKTVFTCDFGKAGHHYTVRIKQPFDARKDVVEGLLAQ